MELYLIRHGECYKGSLKYYEPERRIMNPPLNDTGTEQAKKLALRCKDISFDIIMTSDMQRATQTAEILNEACKSKVKISEAFREINMGNLYTKIWADFPDIYAEWKRREKDIAYPDGESGEDVWQRCKEEIFSLANQFNRAAVVCHAWTIRAIICGLLGIPHEKRFYLGFPLENCSITVIKHNREENKFYLHAFNDCSHLLM